MDDKLLEAYRDAADLNGTHNIAGLVKAFACHAETIRREANRLGEGNDWIASHPVTRLFLWRLTDLVGSPITSDAAYDDYKACRAAIERDERESGTEMCETPHGKMTVAQRRTINRLQLDAETCGEDLSDPCLDFLSTEIYVVRRKYPNGYYRTIGVCPDGSTNT